MKYLIETKHLAATETKGARIVATCAVAKKMIPYPHEAHDPRLSAAQALCRHMGWNHLKLDEVVMPDGVAGFVAQSK